MHNHEFWGRHFRRVFIPHLRRLLEVLEVRFLPTLGTIEDEASALREKAYQELCEMPSDGNGDLSEFAEAAQDLALEFYSGMTSVRQAVLNAYAPILYHTWEQQLLTFHRREMLHPQEENDKRFMRLDVLIERLGQCGIVLGALPSWATIDELRVVANAVKHADGTSADALRERFPRYFDDPGLVEGITLRIGSTKPRVYLPLSGDDIYLRLEHLRRFVGALVDFWSEFEAAFAGRTVPRSGAC
jgi:hypothetical protein